MSKKEFPRIGSAVIVVKNGKVLLGKRAKDPGRGNWVIPGGGIRPFESIIDTGVREIKEETSLDVKIVKQLGAYEIINPPREHRIIIYSIAKVAGGILSPSDDISELKFYSKKELAQLSLTEFIKCVLTDAGFLN